MDQSSVALIWLLTDILITVLKYCQQTDHNRSDMVA